jgi:arylsulfatase A-like enzyme
MLSSAAKRARSLGAWLWPSLPATALALVVAGVAESLRAGDAPLALATSVGLATAYAGPPALGASLVLRGLWLGWRPVELGERLREPGGASPRLWAWLAYLAIAAAALATVTRVAVLSVARMTAFKPLGVSLLMPLFVVPAALVLVALSRPCVDGLAALVRHADARLARRLGRPVATARVGLIGALCLTVILPLAAWYIFVKPRIGFVDTRVALYPAIAVVLVPVAHRLVRRRHGRALAAASVGVAVAAMAAALWVRTSRPVLILDIWDRPTVASEAIDRLIDLEAMRRELSVKAFRPVERPGATHPDVILITFDTVRADRTPLLGGPAAMPHLAGLGQRGVVFEWAFSPGNVTRRSLPSLATGASPSRIRGKVRGWALRLDPRHVVVFERFRAAGYATAGFLCCEGFFDPKRRLGLTRGIDHLVIDRDGATLAAEARAWFEARRAAGDRTPAMVWLHFIESHNWYEESREIAAQSDRARYDHVLGKVDGFLGSVLAGFDSVPAAQSPIVVVTADHGEGLMDHAHAFHSSDLYNSQTRVPLVISGPGITPGRRREPVALVDLAPTLLDLAGFEPPGMPQMDGRSLADLVTGRRADDPDGGFAYAEMVRDRFVSKEVRSLVRGRWKLIDAGGQSELYDIRSDPDERRDLTRIPSPPPELSKMRAAMLRRLRDDRIPAFVTGR